MRRTTPDEARAALKSFEQMRDVGALSPNSFYKCVVTLASEWLCRHDDTEEALILLNRCPPSYYGQVLKPQMQEDYLFAVAVIELTHKVIQYGVIDTSINRPTMPVAQA